MKKVLYIYTDRYGGGVQSVMNEEAYFYSKIAGPKSAFVASRSGSSDLQLSTALFGFLNFFKIKNFVKARGVGVIHIHGFFLLGVILPYLLSGFAKKNRVKVFTTVHNYTITCPSQKRYNFRSGKDCYACKSGPHRYFFESCEDVPIYKRVAKFLYFMAFRYLCSSSDKVFYPSLFAKKYNEDFTSKGVVIENPVRAASLINKNRSVLEGDILKIGYLGRFTEEKGIKELALCLAKNSKSLDSLSLSMAGEGPLKKEVLRILEDADINHFDFGFLQKEKLDEFYGTIDILVIPSLWHESFCLVGFEALLRGIPVLCSNRGEIGRFVKEHGVGEVFSDFAELKCIFASLAVNLPRYEEKLLSVSSWLTGTLSPEHHAERLRHYYDA